MGRRGSDATAGAAHSVVQKAGEAFTAVKDTVTGGAAQATDQAAVPDFFWSLYFIHLPPKFDNGACK